MSDYWDDVGPAMKEESQNRRAKNRQGSAELLKGAGIEFESKSNGAHLIVKGKNETFDFWPGTGLWIGRKSNKRKRGVRKLMSEINA